MLTILIVILVIALIGGGFGHSRGYGAAGWSPLAVVLVVFLVLWVSGYLRR